MFPFVSVEMGVQSETIDSFHTKGIDLDSRCVTMADSAHDGRARERTQNAD